MKCFNQTFCEKLAKIAEEMTMWDEFIDPILMAYCTIKHAITRVTSFLLMYSREAILFIDESYDFCMKDHMMQIVKKVLHIKEKAWHMIWHFQ